MDDKTKRRLKALGIIPAAAGAGGAGYGAKYIYDLINTVPDQLKKRTVKGLKHGGLAGIGLGALYLLLSNKPPEELTPQEQQQLHQLQYMRQRTF